MAADPKISNAAAIAACDAITALVGTAAAGALKIYDATGGIPTDVDSAITTQVLLATLALSTDAFASASDIAPGARADINTVTSSTNAAAGVAAFFRMEDSAGTEVLQGTCGTASADLVMNTVNIASGATVGCSSFYLVIPEG